MSSAELLEVLRRTSLFAGLTEEQLDQVAELVHTMRFRPGEQIIEAASTEAVGLWIVLEGEAEVQTGGTPVYRFEAGDYFGELALLTPEPAPRSADVHAVGDLTAVELSKQDLSELLASVPEIALSMLAELARRLRRTTRLLEELQQNLADETSAARANRSLVEDDELFGSIARGLMTPPISRFGPDRPGDPERD